MSKKVLFVTTIIRTVEAFLLPHIHYFLSKGYEVGIATNTENQQLNYWEKTGVKIHHIPFSRKLMNKDNLASYKMLKSIIKQYQLLHLHTPIASFLTRMASSKEQVVIYSVHGFHFNENGSWLSNSLYKLAEKTMGFKTDKLIVTNKEDLSAAKSIVSEKKIHYVHGVGLDTSLYDDHHFSEKTKQQMKYELGLDLDRKIITHIAEFNENKRQIDLVHACELLKDKMENFTFLLVGNGENFGMIQKTIKDRKLDRYIKCLGFRTDISTILSITDIGLLVSIREGLPRSVMEMMAMKIPVIATNIRGNRDLIINGENGYLVPIKDPVQIAEKCAILLNNEDLIQQFGEKGREFIQLQFSLDNVLQEMELIYQDLQL